MHLLPYTVAHAFFIQLSNYYADASRRAVSRTLPTTSLLLIKKRMAAKKKKWTNREKGEKKMNFWLDVLLCVLTKVTMFCYLYMTHAGQGQTKSPLPKSSTGIDRLYTHTRTRNWSDVFLLLNGRCCVGLYTAADIEWANIIGTPLRALLGYHVAEKQLKNTRKCCLYSSKETSAFFYQLFSVDVKCLNIERALGLGTIFSIRFLRLLCLYNIQHCDNCPHA